MALSARPFWRKAYIPASTNNTTNTQPPTTDPMIIPVLDLATPGPDHVNHTQYHSMITILKPFTSLILSFRKHLPNLYVSAMKV